MIVHIEYTTAVVADLLGVHLYVVLHVNFNPVKRKGSNNSEVLTCFEEGQCIEINRTFPQ